MTAETVPAAGSESIQAGMEFYDNASLGARRAGILDPGYMRDALDDPRTITAELPNGLEVPLFVPMEHGLGAGYDVERCVKDILHQENGDGVFVYLSPGDILGKLHPESYAKVVERIADLTNGYIFSSYGEFDDPLVSSQFELNQLLAAAGKVRANIPLQDSKAQPGHEDASISLYAMDFPSLEDSKDRPLTPWAKVYETYVENVQNGTYDYDPVDGTVMMRGSDIPEEQADEMWGVYLNRFQWLGENHPISMEDTKGAFMQILRGPSTVCSIKFQGGKPVCFTDIVGDPSELYWLNQDFLTDPTRIQKQPNQTTIFFPGIVASPESVNGSYDVIGLLTHAVYDSGGAYRVIFENTNLSEGYVPRIVRGAINKIGKTKVDPATAIDKTNYVCTQFATVGQ